MLIIGLVGFGLPFIGFEFRGLGRFGTWVTAAVVFSVGMIALMVSVSPRLTNFVRLITKSALALVVVAVVLLLLAIPVMIVYFHLL